MSNIVRTAETSLDVADLRRAFKVVEEVTAADNIHSFREAVVNALGHGKAGGGTAR